VTRTAPYGAWRSPLSAERVAGAAVGLGQIAVDGDDVYWVETRPVEAGRSVLVRWRGGEGAVDLTPPPWGVRTRVHEYGGGAFAVGGGIVCFSHDADQRVYRLGDDGVPTPITPAGRWRYADGVVDRARGLLLAVREDHTAGGEPVNALVRIDLAGRATPQVLAAGADFYAAPRLSPDGRQLAWIEWNHPDMPWDGTTLWTAQLDAAGDLHDARRVAGSRDESILQPDWSPDGVLHCVSDRSGWWNLYRVGRDDLTALCPRAAEFALPPWAFGTSSYAFLSATMLVCAWADAGRWQMGRLDVCSGALEPFDRPWTEIGSVRTAGGRVVLRAASPSTSPAIVVLDAPDASPRVLRQSVDVGLDATWVSTPEAVTFAGAGGAASHALLYRPVNPEHVAPAGERPPLLVRCHGGPTGAANAALDVGLQYWTTRGIAVLDVDYAGSTGYGRTYRRRLDGGWGIVDVEDCIAAARTAVARGWADEARLAVRGSSAGGFTVLCALAFHDVFRAGASWYGIGDLEALAHDTHKFEAHYEERLVGPYPAMAERYRARSPLHAAAGITCPVIFFQGLDDPVVPPSQAEAMVAAMRTRGLPVAYLAFPGESHGFRRADTIRRALEAELSFYGQVLGFLSADAIVPVAIDGWPAK
jgi:dipeptidyl aminopeptidase/acylaminoacyl peptidase